MNKFIILLLTSLFFITGCEDHDYCNDEMGAYIAGTRLIKDHLKSPSSAKFPRYSNGNITKKIGECRYLSLGYVESQNGFGVMVKTEYDVEVVYEKSLRQWDLVNFNFR
ncbi:hypothetical protein [Vibrio sp. V15_P4S5T153]|uniref:hypothetical protein n=4 Tax=unclassified Vibrio TaxID=2614977 RepID=UPI000B8F6F19|nr:hypothetical protein [Vibrio sp. V15_P4S5T153]OXX59202.1 hypothetical protein B9J89_19660 [Vibrio sp. V15_P4S5T153]